MNFTPEQRLTNTLRLTTETLNLVTVERDKLKVDLENIWRQYELDMGAISDVIPYLEQIIAERDALKKELKNVENQESAYTAAKRLAEWLFKTHYAADEDYASGNVVWEVCDTTTGIISQIDNMVSNLVRIDLSPVKPAKAKYTTGHCSNNKQPGGCQLHNLQCGYPECDRKPV